MAARREAYFNAFTRGFGFLDRLIIQERDEWMLPNPDFALGGLRQGIHYSEIRTDFVQHSLSAIVEFVSAKSVRQDLQDFPGLAVCHVNPA